ncbi:MAG: mercury methylation corrinoid protein HgcA, partial [Planctomycetia bacterium]|nr:mercury methylation corrinoid protein HgcA [Planctomycetia bacterium]
MLEGKIETPRGEVRRVSTTLSFADRVGSFKARWGIGRMHYTAQPGLYAVGQPGAESPVLVSANYKMSFDRLRSQLCGMDAWILVLDTDGINVWCAAGKGTFGTEEILRRLDATGLGEIVSHRTLILPQLGATGVKAHEVKARGGFRILYGPVRAEDVPEFLSAGMKATPRMRRVRFDLRDRVVLIPMEVVMSLKWLLLVAAGMLVLSGLSADGYSLHRWATAGLRSVLLLVGAYLAGAAVVPMLLPWVPGRAFSLKGAWVGLALALALSAWWLHEPSVFAGRLVAVAWLLMIPSVASFLAMNFTGASTYTSLSG